MAGHGRTLVMFFPVVFAVIAAIAVVVGIVYLFVLIIKALRRYIGSSEVREEKRASLKTLGEVIKNQRVEHKMTQEFVAEHLGVSRQAVSKWESGVSDPSTSNLMALAKLFDITPEELLKAVEK